MSIRGWMALAGVVMLASAAPFPVQAHASSGLGVETGSGETRMATGIEANLEVTIQFRKSSQSIDHKIIILSSREPRSPSARPAERLRFAQAAGGGGPTSAADAPTRPATSGDAPPASPAAPTSPADYQISFVREGDTLALGGFVPSEAARAAILAALRAGAPDLSVFDMTEVKPAAPDGFEAGAVYAAGLVMALKPGAVMLSGPGLTVEGRAETVAARARLTAALAALPAGMTLQRVALALPVVKPFVLSLRRDAQGLALEGAIASEEERAAVLAAAAATLPGVAVNDRLALAEGAPAGIDRMAAIRFALVQLARLKDGQARLEDGKLSMSGQAADRAGYAAANLAVRATPLPGGVTLESAVIGLPVVAPYRWFVAKDAGGIVLQGYAPSEGVRTSNRIAAEAIFAPLAVRDGQELAEGAPEGFGEAALAAMKQLALLPAGRVSLEDRTLSVAGEAPSEAAANEARAAIYPLAPAGYAVNHAIFAPLAAATPRVAAVTPRAPAPPVSDSCSPKIREEMAAGGIVFQFGRETMRPESVARLRRIAAVMKDCPQVRFSVEGHTDSDGIAEQNVDLSHRRAQAVVSILIRQGIEAGRLMAEGHGATRPLAPNDSPANKARNRRIEFVVR